MQFIVDGYIKKGAAWVPCFSTFPVGATLIFRFIVLRWISTVA